MLLGLACGVPLVALAYAMAARAAGPDGKQGLTALVLAGFVARPVVHLTVMRQVAFFSHRGGGGDAYAYELLGSLIARRWEYEPIRFMTADDFPGLATAALPCNVLALLEYATGDSQPLVGTLLNAFLACWMTVIIYGFLVRDRFVDRRTALWFCAVTLFSPAFLYHTSDTFKDGLNSFLVVTSLVLSIRLSHRLDGRRVAALLLCLAALWHVRHYMVFMCSLPLAVGLIGPGSASGARRWAAGGLLVLVLGGMYLTGSGESLVTNAETTFEYATGDVALAYNASSSRGGSGVVTDSVVVRLLYTVLAPFPWQSGSIGLQLGKIEALIAYAYIYLLYRHRRELWERRRLDVLMIGVFVVPGLLAYGMTMSNVGLIVRQRLPLMTGLGLLATLGYAVRAEAAPPMLSDSPRVRMPSRQAALRRLKGGAS